MNYTLGISEDKKLLSLFRNGMAMICPFKTRIALPAGGLLGQQPTYNMHESACCSACPHFGMEQEHDGTLLKITLHCVPNPAPIEIVSNKAKDIQA